MQVLMDYISELNWVAVVVAAIAAFAVGAIWYSQGVFGKRWMKAAGIKNTGKMDGMAPIMAGSFVTVLISSAALAVIYDVLALDGVVNGAVLGVLVAVAFIGTNKTMHNLFEQKPSDYMWITVLGDVVALAVMGGVLGLFS